MIKMLKSLEEDLMGTSDIYRQHQANKKENTFQFFPSEFIGEMKLEFDARGLSHLIGKRDVEEKIRLGAEKILKACRVQAKNFKKSRDIGIVSNASYISVTLAEAVNPREQAKGKEYPNFDNFSKLKGLYAQELKDFVLDLNEFIKEKYQERLNKLEFQTDFESGDLKIVDTGVEITGGGDVVEGGHLEGMGVFESRVRDAIDNAINQNYNAKVTGKNFKSNMELLGIDLSFVRNDAEDAFYFTAQSRVGNQVAGFESAKEKEKLLKQVRAALARLDDKTPIVGLQGSKSYAEVKGEKLTKRVLKRFNKIPGVTTTKPPEGKDRVVKAEHTDKAKKRKRGPVNSGIKAVNVPKISGVVRNEKPQNLNQYLGVFNAQLQDVVRKNMGPPRLENRTGRFASSVRVTEIQQTKRGFPSIGYTYQKDPYQTFEKGFKRGSQERDPRSLIDFSIREIATQFAMGRFYTRRV